MTHLPKFTSALFHPRYWLSWFGIGMLWLIVQLPYPLIWRLGRALGCLSQHVLTGRVTIAARNLELCFPEKSEEERRILLKQNFESVGMGLIETGMAWFWPDARIQRWSSACGIDQIRHVQQQQRGVLLIGIHFLTLEMGARLFGLYATPGIGVYRPNDNPVIDLVQVWGRMRSNKDMLDRKDLKGMIRALKGGEVIWYAPDHDYGRKGSVFVPLFNVDNVATTSGTYTLARMSKACIVPFVPRRRADGKGYELIILDAECAPPLEDAEGTAAWMNKVIEKCIMMAPEQYMWLHRRFKTLPEGVPSRY